MEENKDLFTPEEPGNDIPEEVTGQEPEIQASQEPATTYRGAGIGRRESPFADSPYVIRHQEQEQPEPYRPRYAREEPVEEPARPKAPKKKGHWGKRLLACGAALALVVSSCLITAAQVNDRWEARVSSMEQDFAGQLQELKDQLEQLRPANTGTSVSGTVGLGDGYTAGQVYAQNVDSVVLIESTIVSELYGQTATGMSSGSGFILSHDGYVVTNFHVVEGATSVNVVLYNGTSYPAALVGYDSTNDIALLKVEAKGLNAVELGSSDDLIVGDQVVAIGNPLGDLTSTLTVGYVSAKARQVNTDGTVITMLQTDCAINSGNSGGPLFNMKGQVVGITTAKYSGSSSSGATIEGIGFAIPIDDVLEEIEELKEFGYIKSAYLGVRVKNMDTTAAEIYGLPVGAYVDSVEEGYCAQKAGIQAKDIIIAVGDKQVENLTDLTLALREYEPGDRVTVTVFRAGRTLELPVVLDERPASAG